MARGKRGKRKNRRGDSEYTKRSKARNKRRASVAESTGQRAFAFRGSADASAGGGRGKGAGGAGGRGRGRGGKGSGRASTPWLMYAGIGLGAYLLLSKK